jgi:hypothetical protein
MMSRGTAATTSQVHGVLARNIERGGGAGEETMDTIRVHHAAWQRSLVMLGLLVAALVIAMSAFVLVRHFAEGSTTSTPATQPVTHQTSDPWPTGNGGPPFRPAPQDSSAGARPALHQ